MRELVMPRPKRISQSRNSKFCVTAFRSFPGANISNPYMIAIEKDV
jgi:hypothetical protein